MGFSQIVTGISVFVTGLLSASCQHKAALPKTPPPAAVITTNSLLHDLGEVTLTNHYERCVQLGGGKECILRPKLVDKRNAEITVTFESKTSAGKIHDMIVTRIDAKNGEPVQIAFGDFQLTLKPNIISE